jgi:hypothetical protein
LLAYYRLLLRRAGGLSHATGETLVRARDRAGPHGLRRGRGRWQETARASAMAVGSRNRVMTKCTRTSK